MPSLYSYIILYKSVPVCLCLNKVHALVEIQYLIHSMCNTESIFSFQDSLFTRRIRDFEVNLTIKEKK